METAINEKVKCPYCEKELSRKGLHGHIRFVHQKDLNGDTLDDVHPSPSKGLVDVVGVATEVRLINAEIAQVKEEYDEGSILFGPDPEREVMLSALETRKKELLEKVSGRVPGKPEGKTLLESIFSSLFGSEKQPPAETLPGPSSGGDRRREGSDRRQGEAQGGLFSNW